MRTNLFALIATTGIISGISLTELCAYTPALDTTELAEKLVDENITFDSEDAISDWTQTFRLVADEPAERTNQLISAQLSGDFSKLQSATLFVFDASGSLVETIELEDVRSSTLFTKFSQGNQLTLEIHSDEPLAGNLVVERLLTPSPGGADAVTGVPTFDLDGPDASVSDASLGATARLIVGRNVFPLNEKYPTGDPDWCTGFLITQALLVTASHCMPSDFCDQTVALFGYSIRSDVEVFARKCESIAYRNGYMDIVVLRLVASDESFETVQFSAESPVVNSSLAVVQHPHGSVRLISTQGCNVVKKIVDMGRSRANLDNAKLANLGFAHSCDTLNGSSGSPIFDKSGQVVGVHQGEVRDLNRAVRAQVILTCLSIDPTSSEIKVLQPQLDICRNEK